ncbi:MAG: 23S rRNA (uracil(1939)-C(5))-methyltransferase RlmD [bacterium]
MPIKPRCPYYGVCGGCQLQHLEYEEQLIMKQGMVREEMDKQGLAGVEVRPTIGMDDPWFYRNKVQFPIRSENNHLIMGYFKRRSHEVVNIKECYIQDPFITEIAQVARKIMEERGLTAYDEKTGQGLMRHFIGRAGVKTNELLLGLVINGKGIPAGFTIANEIKKQERLMHRLVSRHDDYPSYEKKRRIVGIVQNVNKARGNVIMGKDNTTLFGTPYMRERLGKYTFKVGILSFFQVNPIQAVKLYDVIAKFADLSGTEIVVDAYAGIGSIAFWLSGKAGIVVGIEERKEAVHNAQQNIDLNKINNVRMVEGLAEKSFPKKAEVVVLDPPRGGCSEKVLELVGRAAPRQIIYVSCNPETMARDLRILAGAGYKTEVVQPVDMFPQTEHIESVARLSRGG